MNLEEIPVAVVRLDASRTVIAANSEAAALVGVELDELIGVSIAQAFRPRTVAGVDLLVDDWHPSAKLRSTHHLPEQDVLIRTSSGNEVEVGVDGGYERAEDGSLMGATLMMRPRHRGPRRLRSGIRVVSTVSHELRSPLTSVRGYTSLLLKRWEAVDDEDRKMMLQQIDRDARRISRMIGELLDISRLESGRLHLHRQPLQLAKVINDVMDKVRMGFPDVEAEVRVPDEFPAVWADPDKLDQVLTNLVENACKYASPTGIVITAELQDAEAVVEVHDKGAGIPQKDLPRLFQQFFRSRSGRPTGTGLGLWISRGLIEAHGGELTATSVEGVGTTFRFTIPQRAIDELESRWQAGR